MSERTLSQHWPALLLGVLVTCIFVAALVIFTVDETETAVVLTFGKARTEAGGAVKEFKPGLHWKLPYPIESVWTHDNRLQCYELKKGQVEQIQTVDEYQIVVTTYVLWRVGNAGTFLKAVNTTAEAENKLDDVVRNARSNVLGKHTLAELINVDASKVRLTEIEAEILKELRGVALDKYGIQVEFLGFKHIGFPEDVTNKVFERMQAERQRKSEKYRSDGRRDAQKIRSLADLKVSETLATAEAEAKRIRAEGDRTAAEYYAVFSKNPELAAFLRKLDSLRQTVSEKTTLILDTQTPPYDLLAPNAGQLTGSVKAAATPKEGK